MSCFEYEQSRFLRRYCHAFERSCHSCLRKPHKHIWMVVAAFVVVLCLPMMRMVGDGLAPTLQSGQLVVADRHTRYAPGDVIAFYCDKNLLVAEVIGMADDHVVTQSDGTTLVNGHVTNAVHEQHPYFGAGGMPSSRVVPEGHVLVGNKRRMDVQDPAQINRIIMFKKIIF